MNHIGTIVPIEEGSSLENTPKHGSMAELIALAEDREKWRLEVNSLKLSSIANPETAVSVFVNHKRRLEKERARRCTWYRKPLEG